MKHLSLFFSALLLLSTFAFAQNATWVKTFGGSPNSDLQAMVTLDDSGNTYLTGAFKDTVDFDPDSGVFNLACPGKYTPFISKLDSRGHLLWAKMIENPGNNYMGVSMALDDSGNIYLTGSFSGTVDLDPGPGTYHLTSANPGIFVLKLNASGDFVWARGTSSSAGYCANGILALDRSGNIYITGYFHGTVDFDPGPGTLNLTKSNGEVFLLKLNTQGNLVWGKKCVGMNTSDIVVDGTDKIYITGTVNGSFDFDPGPGSFILNSLGTDDAFVTKMDTAGNFVWAQHSGTDRQDYANCVTLDNIGNVYMCGLSNDDDSFISKIDSSGTVVWTKNLLGDSVNPGVVLHSIVLDATGSIYTSGYFRGRIDFDPDTTTYFRTALFIDALILKLNAAGQFVWCKQIGGSSYDVAGVMALDAAGNIHACMSFGGTVDFDPGPGVLTRTAIRQNDFAILKLNPSGNISTSLFEEDRRPATEISIYPNPVNDVITINPGDPTDNMSYTLRCMTGAEILTGKLDQTAITINIAHLLPGFYFIEINGINSKRLKVLKQ